MKKNFKKRSKKVLTEGEGSDIINKLSGEGGELLEN